MCNCNTPQDLVVRARDFTEDKDNPGYGFEFTRPFMAGLRYRLLDAGSRIMVREGYPNMQGINVEYFDTGLGFSLTSRISLTNEDFYLIIQFY